MLGRKVVEGEQRVAVLGQAGDRLLVFGPIFLGEYGDSRLRRGTVRCCPDLAQVGPSGGGAAGCFADGSPEAMAAGWTDLGGLSSTLAVLCTVQR